MLATMCWILMRPDMTWHVLPQAARDPRGLFERPTLCGLVSPEGPLGVLAFTQSDPVGLIRRCVQCAVCEAAQRAAHRAQFSPAAS